MDVALATVCWQYTFVCIDDTIIFLRASGKHLQHNEEVLRLLNNARMTIILKTYSFPGGTIIYLDHVAAPGKLCFATKTTKATKALQYPTWVSELQLFVGLIFQKLYGVWRAAKEQSEAKRPF